MEKKENYNQVIASIYMYVPRQKATEKKPDHINATDELV